MTIKPGDTFLYPYPESKRVACNSQQSQVLMINMIASGSGTSQNANTPSLLMK